MRIWLLPGIVATLLLLTGCEGIDLTVGKTYPDGWTVTDVSLTPKTDAWIRDGNARYEAAQREDAARGR